jgi:hypothetical protein
MRFAPSPSASCALFVRERGGRANESFARDLPSGRERRPARTPFCGLENQPFGGAPRALSRAIRRPPPCAFIALAWVVTGCSSGSSAEPRQSTGEAVTNDGGTDAGDGGVETGALVCELGFVACGSARVDTAFDANNCGACSVVCPSGWCNAGTCGTASALAPPAQLAGRQEPPAVLQRKSDERYELLPPVAPRPGQRLPGPAAVSRRRPTIP